MSKNNIICIIPARGGSKGIPKKNLQELEGKPLLYWSIKVAQLSGVVDRILVSTDDQEIASLAQSLGAEVPFLRPNHLALDHVHSVYVVIHLLNWIESQENKTPEGLLMLLPTSPLRRPQDIQNAVKLFREYKAKSVVSVTELGKYLTNLRYLRSGQLEIVDSNENLNAQRQGLEEIYAVNGSIFLARPKDLQKEQTFHMKGTRGYVMPMLNSIDINSPEDLNLARQLAPILDLQSLK